MENILQLSWKIFSRPTVHMSDFYHAFQNNYFDITCPENSTKREKDYFERDNFFFEFVKPVMPKSRNWISSVSSEYHWMQNVMTTTPKGYVDMLVFCPLLFKLPVFQHKTNNLPYTTKYMIGFYEKPSEWKIKSCIYAIQNMKPYFDVYTEGVFYVDLKEYAVHFVAVDYKKPEMVDKKNKILHLKRFHTIYEKNSSMYPRWAYPNFCNGCDCSKKTKIATELGEISQLYYCKKKIRKKCHDNGIFSYKDDAFHLMLKKNIPEKQYETIMRILRAQKKNENFWYIIDKNIVQDDNFNRLVQSRKIYYIDFETTRQQDVYLIGILSSDNTFVFMWENPKEEFSRFLDENKDAIFVYYMAEMKFAKKMFGDDYCDSITENWIDLCPILTNYCAFQNAFDFKLKSVQKAFFQKGILTEKYSEECSNGLKSIELYEEYCETKNDKIKQDLIYYNYLDCLFTKDIAQFIYKNYQL